MTKKGKTKPALWAEKICAYCGNVMFINLGRSTPTATNRKCHPECAPKYLKLHHKYTAKYPKFDHYTDIGAYMGYGEIASKLNISAQAAHAIEKSGIRKMLRRLREKHKPEWTDFIHEFDETFDSNNEMIMVVYLLVIYFADEFKKMFLTYHNDKW